MNREINWCSLIWFYRFEKLLGYDRGGRFYEEEDSACPALLEREFHSIHRNVPGLRRAGVDTNAIRQVSNTNTNTNRCTFHIPLQKSVHTPHNECYKNICDICQTPWYFTACGGKYDTQFYCSFKQKPFQLSKIDLSTNFSRKVHH